MMGCVRPDRQRQRRDKFRFLPQLKTTILVLPKLRLPFLRNPFCKIIRSRPSQSTQLTPAPLRYLVLAIQFLSANAPRPIHKTPLPAPTVLVILDAEVGAGRPGVTHTDPEARSAIDPVPLCAPGLTTIIPLPAPGSGPSLRDPRRPHIEIVTDRRLAMALHAH